MSNGLIPASESPDTEGEAFIAAGASGSISSMICRFWNSASSAAALPAAFPGCTRRRAGELVSPDTGLVSMEGCVGKGLLLGLTSPAASTTPYVC